MGGSALLEIDFQGWILDLAHDERVVDAAVELRQRRRAAGADVFCLRYLNLAPGGRSDPTSEATAYVPRLRPEATDLILSKHSRDAFDNPDLLANLHVRGIDRLVIDGLLTDHGVRLAALSALALGFDVCVAAPACAGSDTTAHERALRTMASEGVRILG